ncbi:MAG: EamA family transporter [Proteobacteria bacterium]|nr:EamA family transporter [Pseudomonadota bacterium]
MGVGVFLAVLFAAFLHAAWNAVIKSGTNKLQGMVLLSIAHAFIGLAMVIAFPVPDPAAFVWLAISVVLHLIYKTFLTLAYQKGDLSRVYPISRGTAPVMVLIVSLLFLNDEFSAWQMAGVVLVGFGILMMARGVFTNDEQRGLLPFALIAAMGTAGYTLADGIGARVSLHPSAFVGWVFLLDSILFTSWALAFKGLKVLPKQPRVWALGLVAGSASVVAYWIAVWAMTVAPIALVATLRETSVLFAVLIGVVFLKEKSDKGKVLAALVIVSGIVLMRL